MTGREYYSSLAIALNRGNTETANKLRREIREDLRSKGLIETNDFGWVKQSRLEEAIRRSYIVEIENDYRLYAPLTKSRPIIRGRKQVGSTNFCGYKFDCSTSELLAWLRGDLDKLPKAQSVDSSADTIDLDDLF